MRHATSEGTEPKLKYASRESKVASPCKERNRRERDENFNDSRYEAGDNTAFGGDTAVG